MVLITHLLLDMYSILWIVKHWVIVVDIFDVDYSWCWTMSSRGIPGTILWKKRAFLNSTSMSEGKKSHQISCVQIYIFILKPSLQSYIFSKYYVMESTSVMCLNIYSVAGYFISAHCLSNIIIGDVLCEQREFWNHFAL